MKLAILSLGVSLPIAAAHSSLIKPKPRNAIDSRLPALLASRSSPPVPPAPAIPRFHGCLPDGPGAALPYCNTSLSPGARADDLLDRLTFNETVGQLAAPVGSTHPHTCHIDTPPVPRLGLPGYTWLTEGNSVIITACLTPSRCPTTFVGPAGMAASFNRSSWAAKGDVLSTDARVLNAYGVRAASAANDDVGLSVFGPNLNLLKDPRWGRASEVPGEDPYLSGEYGVAYTQGLQQLDAATGHFKVLSYVKHFAAYNVEEGRMTNAFNGEFLSCCLSSPALSSNLFGSSRFC